MKLQKFMWCMTLETIGLVIGFLGVSFCAVSLFSLICGFFYFLYIIISLNSEEQQQGDDVSGPLTIIAFGIIIAIMVVSAFTYVYVLLIKGIRNKQHEKMKPWLVLQCIAIVINFLQMLSFLDARIPSSYIVSHIAGSAFAIYCYMAVESLYENIKEESERGLLTNEQTTGISMPPAYSIAEEKKSQMDFNYVKLV